MSITYTWSLTSTPQGVASQNGFTNVVTKLSWKLTGSDGVNTASTTGDLQLPPPADSGAFVPANQVTMDVITGWLENMATANQQYAVVAVQLATMSAPTLIDIPVA